MLRLAIQVPVDCRQPIWLKQAHGTEMAIFALKQTADFNHNQDTPLYMCFLNAKDAFERINHWTLAKNLSARNVPLQIVKLFILRYS